MKQSHGWIRVVNHIVLSRSSIWGTVKFFCVKSFYDENSARNH